MADYVGYVERFNAAVVAGDFDAFVAELADDAIMAFEGVPVGPFHGREAIRQAYTEQPPTDTLTVLSADGDATATTLRFAWDHGGGGSMRLVWQGERARRVTIAFDGEA